MKTLFFDLDGTLADSQEGIINSIHYMIQKAHLPLLSDDIYRLFIGPSLGSSLHQYYPALSESEIDQTIQYYHEFYLEQGIFQQSLYPGILAALAQLQAAGYQLNIASAKPEPMVDQIAERFDLNRYFTGLYGATMDERIRSSKTAVLEYALTQSGADPNQALMIGDRNTDMIGGANNHVKTLGVTYGFGTATELQAAGADAIVASPAELPQAAAKLLTPPIS
ncbi:HAD hydrolase-like protein [Lacticaseibacillus jixianensis]|uniref:HAD hydrolase-like protein n=1 Tax=Lacticaseibacillus jixianensis TaxID=2486012 RepID=A0ABW4B895_9LACO|nr:HAD hydrolase-like protein [Lacticaseibacillus jixianensis]